MKRRLLLVLELITLVVLLFIPATVFAQVTCDQSQTICPPQSQHDLAVLKEVSIDGGTFVDADTVGTSAQAYIGQTVTWRIIVSNAQSLPFGPSGTITLQLSDVIPTAFSIKSVTATEGIYDTGSGLWSVPLPIAGGVSETLTIVTKPTIAGFAIENDAVLSGVTYNTDGIFTSSYEDDNVLNDSNKAFVTVLTKPIGTPQVLGASTTLANTAAGSSLKAIVAIILLGLALVVGLVGNRQYVNYRFDR